MCTTVRTVHMYVYVLAVAALLALRFNGIDFLTAFGCGVAHQGSCDKHRTRQAGKQELLGDRSASRHVTPSSPSVLCCERGSAVVLSIGVLTPLRVSRVQVQAAAAACRLRAALMHSNRGALRPHADGAAATRGTVPAGRLSAARRARNGPCG